jgi:hypothetical protein
MTFPKFFQNFSSTNLWFTAFLVEQVFIVIILIGTYSILLDDDLGFGYRERPITMETHRLGKIDFQ